jgi:hypothetical protein
MSTIFENIFGESIIIENQSIIDRQGGNFGCEVFRLVIKTLSGKTYYLIMKKLPEDENIARMVVESGVMKRENLMYGRILNLFNNIINVPHCYFSQNDSLILQDMYSLGFKTGSRLTGLDINHCRLALRELAKFHSSSVILRCRKPEVFESEMTNFIEPIYTEENRDVMTAYMKSCLNNIAATLKGREQLRYVSIAEEIDALTETAYDVMVESVTRYSNILVLTHGDFWTGNLLFKYAINREPIECTVIDFQVSYLTIIYRN